MPLISKTNSLKENLRLVFEALKRATEDKDHPFRYLTLGTTSSAGIGLRKVVLRKVDERNHCWIFTDKRSGKIADLKSNGICTLLFYDQMQKLQCRLNCRGLLHINTEKTLTVWAHLSETSRKSYTSKTSPGTRIADPSDAYIWPDTSNAKNFCMIELIPLEIEVLQLNKTKHLRAKYVWNGQDWEMSWIAP
jgi:pyridoxine/pyridoxamine 5'-phosphate oxidase